MGIQMSILPEEKIFEANSIARAQWSTSNVWVQRIAAILINKINPDDKKFKPSEIPLHEIIGSKGGKSYTLIRNIAKELITQHVILPIPETKKDFIIHNIFKTGIVYSEKKDTIKICLNPELAPFYLELKRNFVAYGLTEFLSLPGTYHQSLYKFLKSWESEPSKTVEVAELHRILHAAPSLCSHYGRFDQKALRPAHKFINENTALKYDYGPQKVGRKVVSVVFTFHSRPKYRKAPAAQIAAKAGKGGKKNAGN